MAETNIGNPGFPYKPSEILDIISESLARQSVNAQVIFVRGVYKPTGVTSYNGYFYDTLKDENCSKEITIILKQEQRSNLKDGNVIKVGGTLNRKINDDGKIQVRLSVSRTEYERERVLDEKEIKSLELIQKKSTSEFKNIDHLLDDLLDEGTTPKIALLYAETSITKGDFQTKLDMASELIDFEEHRVSFANTDALVEKLQQLDKSGFHAIAIIRGGGSGLEKLDEIPVLEALSNMHTPVIGAVGHAEERLHFKKMVDKEVPTPTGLGDYLSRKVENVLEKQSQREREVRENEQFKNQLTELQDEIKNLKSEKAKTEQSANAWRIGAIAFLILAFIIALVK